MHAAPVHRARRGDQGLAQHLPAEDLRRADVTALAAEQVVLEALEVEQLQQVGESRVHGGRSAQSGGATPSRSRMIGLVVVYCRNCRFSG